MPKSTKEQKENEVLTDLVSQKKTAEPMNLGFGSMYISLARVLSNYNGVKFYGIALVRVKRCLPKKGWKGPPSSGGTGPFDATDEGLHRERPSQHHSRDWLGRG
jgi:hypothetical protein